MTIAPTIPPIGKAIIGSILMLNSGRSDSKTIVTSGAIIAGKNAGSLSALFTSISASCTGAPFSQAFWQ